MRPRQLATWPPRPATWPPRSASGGRPGMGRVPVPGIALPGARGGPGTPGAPPGGALRAPAAGCAKASGVFSTGLPWAQTLLDPTAVWPLTTGAGVLVAVLGTGVDTSNAQFGRGQVIAGADYTDTPKSTTV